MNCKIFSKTVEEKDNGSDSAKTSSLTSGGKGTSGNGVNNTNNTSTNDIEAIEIEDDTTDDNDRNDSADTGDAARTKDEKVDAVGSGTGTGKKGDERLVSSFIFRWLADIVFFML